ncbi:MAG: hypothetical protein NT062_17995, partial [Proteobacteria bacterium]|nr:hypothetical protein [Pseudomonadota bacterium]
GPSGIARELGISRNRVRRYLPRVRRRRRRPGAWTLDAEQQATARAMLDGPAAGNGVVVQRLLAAAHVDVPLRTVQRVLSPHRQAKRADEVATVRFETAPGHQIDFGEKWIEIAGARTKIVRRRARPLAADLHPRVAEPAPGRLPSAGSRARS